VYTDNDELAVILASLRDWGRDCTCPRGSIIAAADVSRTTSASCRTATTTSTSTRTSATTCAPPTCRRPSAAPSSNASRGSPPGAAPTTRASAPRWRRLPTFSCCPRHPGQPAELVRLSADAARRGQGCRGRPRRHRAPARGRLDPDAHAVAGNVVRQPCFDGRRASGTGYRVASALANTDRLMNDAFWSASIPV